MNGGDSIRGAVSRHESSDILLCRGNLAHDDTLYYSPGVSLVNVLFFVLSLWSIFIFFLVYNKKSTTIRIGENIIELYFLQKKQLSNSHHSM